MQYNFKKKLSLRKTDKEDIDNQANKSVEVDALASGAEEGRGKLR